MDEITRRSSRRLASVRTKALNASGEKAPSMLLSLFDPFPCGPAQAGVHASALLLPIGGQRLQGGGQPVAGTAFPLHQVQRLTGTLHSIGRFMGPQRETSTHPAMSFEPDSPSSALRASIARPKSSRALVRVGLMPLPALTTRKLMRRETSMMIPASSTIANPS